ncbi:MAG: glycoside hydrolase family 15 protein [Chloroflexi bacterium]|uniref:glycoside hydrolase family 15 protein n=1 Tax=Candidatus Flexifilum breve TaxID=3140694 RepID=UPI003134ED7D|nr:glycoside hydrolase family 15 protein [Chloroflexota bacterium]
MAVKSPGLTPLHEHSLKVILDNQNEGGGYLACPVMPDYQFSWFRDGAFIAYALTVDGTLNPIPHAVGRNAQWDSADRFHRWCARMINSRAAAIERTIARAANGEPLVLADTLNARYQLHGDPGPDDWPEFQLDGPAIWLWSLTKYVDVCRVRPLPLEWEQAVELTARYLAAIWQSPCNDCWEERGTEVHVSTLAAIFAGLNAAEYLVPRLNFSAVKDAIQKFIFAQGITPGYELAKAVGLDMVDANLLLAALPDFGLLKPDDPLMQRTIARIERDLLAQGHGVHRHRADTYYGGGAWVLLGLWLAWYYTQIGQPKRAQEILGWAEAHADSDGNLPEQVNDVMFAPDFYEPWVQKRGEIAQPLLWTHAKYLLVRNALAT